jgi:hypothetical protein
MPYVYEAADDDRKRRQLHYHHCTGGLHKHLRIAGGMEGGGGRSISSECVCPCVYVCVCVCLCVFVGFMCVWPPLARLPSDSGVCTMLCLIFLCMTVM